MGYKMLVRDTEQVCGMWAMKQERCGTTAVLLGDLLTWGLAKHKVCPRGTTPAAKHYSFCPFPPLPAKYSPEPGQGHAKEQDADATTARQNVSVSWQENCKVCWRNYFFFLFGRQGELQKFCSTSTHTNTLLEMPHRDTGRVVRTRPTELMKMSKMILLK